MTPVARLHDVAHPRQEGRRGRGLNTCTEEGAHATLIGYCAVCLCLGYVAPGIENMIMFPQIKKMAIFFAM